MNREGLNYTQYETDVLERMLANGSTFVEIAEKLCRSRSSVRHRINRLRKTEPLREKGRPPVKLADFGGGPIAKMKPDRREAAIAEIFAGRVFESMRFK